jgi:4-hydroxy-3-polyprenylbenzoate decarboxylase
MPFTDLREYLEKLESEGELIKVSAEVDPHLEIGAVTRRACERRAPAPLFENIKGYPGHRMAGVLMGPGKQTVHSRIAIALGLDSDTPPLELIEYVRARAKTPREPLLASGVDVPCKENILMGDEANLMSLPNPWIKEIDGGQYVGTWDIVITKDPDTGWTNWGVYRCMVRDEKSFAILLFPGSQHGGSIFSKYEARGKPMPIALVIGADPLSQLAAITSCPTGVSEAGVAGGLMGAPPVLVKCETSDLAVPASAEIVIEAEVMPGERTEEGPFGEYTGHTAHRGLTPLARVRCITHRNNPVFTMANMGKPWDDSAPALSILLSALAKDRLESHGVPVKSVYYHAPSTAVVVSISQRPGAAKRVVSVLTSGHRMVIGPGIVIVDEDVDVTNLEDVWWAVTTRMHPERFEVFKGVSANPLIPYLTPEERANRETSLWIMNATFPSSWSPEYRKTHTQVADFKNAWSEDVRRKVVERWAEYGYE